MASIMPNKVRVELLPSRLSVRKCLGKAYDVFRNNVYYTDILKGTHILHYMLIHKTQH